MKCCENSFALAVCGFEVLYRLSDLPNIGYV